MDTTRRGEVRVGLVNGRLQTLTKTFDRPGGSQALVMVDRLLRQSRAKLAQLTGIVVASGPGPFSALRSACAIANALSDVLRIPVVGVAGEMTMGALAERGNKKMRRAMPGVPVVPRYGRPPHITKAKRR